MILTYLHQCNISSVYMSVIDALLDDAVGKSALDIGRSEMVIIFQLLSPWPSNHKLFFVTAVKIYH